MHFQNLWSMGYHTVHRNVVLLVSRVGVTNLTTQNTAAFCKSLIFNDFLACGSSPSAPQVLALWVLKSLLLN